jgi:hypothetical protein
MLSQITSISDLSPAARVVLVQVLKALETRLDIGLSIVESISGIDIPGVDPLPPGSLPGSGGGSGGGAGTVSNTVINQEITNIINNITNNNSSQVIDQSIADLLNTIGTDTLAVLASLANLAKPLVALSAFIHSQGSLNLGTIRGGVWAATGSVFGNTPLAVSSGNESVLGLPGNVGGMSPTRRFGSSSSIRGASIDPTGQMVLPALPPSFVSNGKTFRYVYRWILEFMMNRVDNVTPNLLGNSAGDYQGYVALNDGGVVDFFDRSESMWPSAPHAELSFRNLGTSIQFTGVKRSWQNVANVLIAIGNEPGNTGTFSIFASECYLTVSLELEAV